MATTGVMHKLSESDKKQVEEGFGQIRSVLEKHNINVADVIGLVTTDQVKTAGDQIQIRFAELAGPQMNMIAFD